MTESACLRHTEIPHTSKLFSDFQYHFDRVARFYGRPASESHSFADAARQMTFPAERRGDLVSALRAQNGPSPSGPAYSVYKALTAAHLAAELSAQGVPAVPIFWLPTEDHDFAEVNHTFVFDRDHHPVLLSVDGRPNGDRPVGSIPIDAPPLDQLARSLKDFPYAEEVLVTVRESYRPGATFGAAFKNLFGRLLANYGLLFVDPLDPAVRRMAAPLLRRAVEQDDALHGKLLERNQELEAAGYHAQVHVEPKTSVFFLLEGDRRVTLRRQNGQYLAKERRYSAQELSERPEYLSPNALLRPVVQDYVLPTIAYIGGPAELAYLAQSQVLYQDLIGRMPRPVARSGFTLLDARTSKLMKRYGMALPAFFHGEEGARELISQQLVPPALTHQFGQIQQATAASLQHLRNDLVTFDESLASAADKTRAKVLYQLSKIERKTAREALNRNQRAAEEARYMSGLIYPEKHLQERLYSILPFLAKHGLGLTETLYEHIRLDCPDHRVLVIS